MDDVLSTEGSLDANARPRLMKQVDGFIARRAVPVRERVRDIALAVYTSAGRDVVEDLMAAS